MATQKTKQRRGKEPLFRKVNTKARGVDHGGGEYRWDRRTKKSRHNDTDKSGMNAQHNGLDYTPLFRFLLSKVGQDWSEIYSEAVSRLDSAEPIYWIVAKNDSDQRAIVRVGESSFYSGLFVNSDDVLQVVEPGISNENIHPWCNCCTHTFNGKPFINKYDPDRCGIE